MPTVKLETYYTIKEDFAKKLIKKYREYSKIAELAKIPRQTVENVFKDGSKLSPSYANKICGIEGIELLEGFDVFEPIVLDKDYTHLQLSEQMLNGFKAKIATRLSVTHSKPFVDEIIDTIDDIIEEACYLGIECQKNKRTDYILKRVFKRRNNG